MVTPPKWFLVYNEEVFHLEWELLFSIQSPFLTPSSHMYLIWSTKIDHSEEVIVFGLDHRSTFVFLQ